jgi:hypothetical protein
MVYETAETYPDYIGTGRGVMIHMKSVNKVILLGNLTRDPERKERRFTGAMKWGPGRTTRREGPGAGEGRRQWWVPPVSDFGAI